jgi:hypothetical protein
MALVAISMLARPALNVTTIRIATPSLALFPPGGALIRGGARVFKGMTGLVLEATPPAQRLVRTSDLLIALFTGLSIPVIGAGVALDRGASAADTVFGFAIFVALASQLATATGRPARHATYIADTGADV